MATQGLDRWFADAFGIDPGQYAPRPATAEVDADADAADEPNQSVETDEAWLNSSIDPGVDAYLLAAAAAKEEAAAARGRSVTKAATELSAKRLEVEAPELNLPGGYFKAKFTLFVTVTGTLETVALAAAETKTLSQSLSSDGYVVKAVEQWVDENGVTVFGWQTVFTEMSFEGAAEVKDGLKVNVSGAGKFASGIELKFTATLININAESKMEAFKLTFGASFPFFALPEVVVGVGSRATLKLKVQPQVDLVLDPNWPAIWARVAEEVAKDVALGARAQAALRTAMSGVNVDVAIASGFLAIGAASIAASAATIGGLNDVRDTPQQCASLTKLLLAGYKIGVLGGDPPSHSAMEVGYAEGRAARDRAVGKLMGSSPGITDEQVEQVLETVADRLVEEARPKLEQAAKEEVWKAFADSHRDGVWKNYANDRFNVWSALFGRAPHGEKLFVDYCNEYTYDKRGQ